MSASPAPKDDLVPWFCHAILIVIAILFVVRNLPWHLDDYDQAKQAFTSYEMVEQGHWWVQHTPTGKIATKPPLAGWISAGLYLASGKTWWNGAWRLPSLACALLVLWMIWKTGTELYGNNIGGITAASAFGLNVFTPRIATLVRTDMMLTTCIFIVGWLILERIRGGERWTLKTRLALFAVLLASMLIKGPIALAFLLPGLVAYAFFARRFGIRNFAWSGFLSWFVPLLVFGAWVWICTVQNAEFYDQVIVKEFLGRFDASETAVHQPRNPFFYIGLLTIRWLPWSLLIIAGFLIPPVRKAMRSDPALLWLACWTLGGLLFMSVIPSKRFDRIMPVVPPACLLIAAMMRHLPNFEWKRQPCGRIAVASSFLGLAIGGGYAGYEVISNYATSQDTLVDFGTKVRELTKSAPDRFAIISGKDEGMLIYAGKTQFTNYKDALEMWRASDVDWLVIPVRTLRDNEREFTPFDWLASSAPCPDKNSYALIKARDDESGTPPAADSQPK